MRRAVHAGQLGVGDVVVGHDVGHQRSHAHEPAAQPDQDQRQHRQDGVLQHAGDERKVESALHVHRIAAADRQHRPHVAEHDQEYEGDDVIGDGMKGHRQDAGELQDPAVAVVAGQAAKQVAEDPR